VGWGVLPLPYLRYEKWTTNCNAGSRKPLRGLWARRIPFAFVCNTRSRRRPLETARRVEDAVLVDMFLCDEIQTIRCNVSPALITMAFAPSNAGALGSSHGCVFARLAAQHNTKTHLPRLSFRSRPLWAFRVRPKLLSDHCQGLRPSSSEICTTSDIVRYTTPSREDVQK
jgi:hypothetical protein